MTFKNVLYKHGIDSVEKLESYSFTELSLLKGVGPKMVDSLIILLGKTPLSCLNVQQRFINILNKHGCYFVESLQKFSLYSLSLLNGIGPVALNEIEQSLIEYASNLKTKKKCKRKRKRKS